jgi:hypothetical protein
MLVPFFYSRILGWRFHNVQAQHIQEYLDGAFTMFKRSLSYWAYPKPFKNISGAFSQLFILLNTRFVAICELELASLIN